MKNDAMNRWIRSGAGRRVPPPVKTEVPSVPAGNAGSGTDIGWLWRRKPTMNDLIRGRGVR